MNKKYTKWFLRIYALGILAFLFSMAILIQLEVVENPIEYKTLTMIVMLLFALQHTKYIFDKADEEEEEEAE